MNLYVFLLAFVHNKTPLIRYLLHMIINYYQLNFYAASFTSAYRAVFYGLLGYFSC